MPRAAAAAISSASIVADHYVMPDLTRQQIEAIRDGKLSLDVLVRDCIHSRFAYRFAAAGTYSEAMAIENAIKAGALGQLPRLNPTRIP